MYTPLFLISEKLGRVLWPFSLCIVEQLEIYGLLRIHDLALSLALRWQVKRASTRLHVAIYSTTLSTSNIHRGLCS